MSSAAGKKSDPWIELAETRVEAPRKTRSAKLGALVNLDLDEAETIDLRRARAKASRRAPSGTAVMMRPLGLMPLGASKSVAPPPSTPRSGERAILARPAAPAFVPPTIRTELDPLALPPSRPLLPFDRRIVWIVSAVLLALVGARAVPAAAARLGTVVAMLSTPSDR